MHTRRLFAYAAVYLLWGGTYLAVRTVVLVTPPFSAAAVRFFISGVLLFAASYRRDEPWPTSTEWRHSALLGLGMFTINYACFFWAEQRLYSGIASVVVATLPVWILLGEWLTGAVRQWTMGAMVGTLLGISGVALVARGGGGVPQSSAHTELATCVLLTGTLCWAIGSIWSRSLVLPARQTTRAALQMGTGGLFLAMLALAAGEGTQLRAALAQWNWVTELCFVYLVAASIVAFTAYTWLLHHEPANRVASYAFVNPVVALALGVSLGHEHVSRWQVLGGAMVLAGVLASLRSKRPAPGLAAQDAKVA